MVRRILAVTAGALGTLAVVVGRPSPAPVAIDVNALAGEIEGQTDHVSALELAAWIRDRKDGLRVLDVRSDSEYAAFHVPSAEHVPLARIASMRPRDGETLVLYSEGGAHAAQAWVLLRALGFRRVYFLSGGLLDWMDDVMSPAPGAAPEVAALSRYFGGVPRTGAVPNASPTGSDDAVRRQRETRMLTDPPSVRIDDFASLRAREFARLDAASHTYLDCTGSALYPDSLVARHAAMLREAVLGNPHSESPASLASSALIAEARSHVLRFFDADPADYSVCFTANASAAIHLVAESFPFGPRAPFLVADDDHNSVNGVREYAIRAGAPVRHIRLDGELRLADVDAALDTRDARGLLALPAQSNFSGVRHPLGIVQAARDRGWTVLLDAAAYVPTSPLSLRDVGADFVALSFYKMFGYPTGVGALIARHEALERLHRPWFAGGTVDAVSTFNDTHLLRAGVEGFEDGTANFLAIGGVCAGLDFMESIGMERIRRHTSALGTTLVDALRNLRHRNGAPLVRIYGPIDDRERGGTVAFNVLDAAGRIVPYCEVEQRARAARVSVRGGCFCNPGAAAAAFDFPRDATIRCLDAARTSGWSLARFAGCMPGRAVGAIRASVGIPSNGADLERLLAVIDDIR